LAASRRDLEGVEERVRNLRERSSCLRRGEPEKILKMIMRLDIKPEEIKPVQRGEQEMGRRSLYC